MQKQEPSNSSRNDDGFTLIETMVSLVVLLLIGVVVWQGIAHTGRLFGKITSNLFSSVRTLHMDRHIREQTGRIDAPYWMKRLQVREKGANSIAIPYLKGNFDSLLYFAFEDQYLVVGEKKRGNEDIAGKLTFGPFRDADMEVVENERGEQYGIRFRLRPAASPKTVEITARFGSNSL